jgi:hypothetical protein
VASLHRWGDGPVSKNEYRRFAAVSLESTENAANLATKTHLLIMADAWLDLAERTTQLVDHEADEARGIMEPPLTRATVKWYRQAAG